MGPVPKDNQTNPADRELPNHSDPEELESPSHVVAPADLSSSDEGDSDGEGPANNGYMLLPQDPEEEGGGDGGDAPQPPPFPPLSALEGEVLPMDSMTEVRGAGVDMSQDVAQGNVHPAFAATFPDNKVPVHLQVPGLPKAKPQEVLWSHTPPEVDRLQLDSAQLSKVQSAMAGFQLPTAHIPEWALHISEDDWKQCLASRLAASCSPPPASTPDTHRTDGRDTRRRDDGGEGRSGW